MLASASVFLAVLHVSHALIWKFDSENGTGMVCPGDTFTFPWTYATEGNEEVLTTFWFSDKKGSFANYFDGAFYSTIPSVTYLGALRMSDVQKNDEDRYGVGVVMSTQPKPLTKYVNLVVHEAPRTEDGQIHVVDLSRNLQNTGSTSYGYKRLQCGKLISRGTPAVAAVWTDPEGHRLFNSTFTDGYFYLELAPYVTGGNYTCSIKLDAEATKCFQDESPTTLSSSVYVETLESEVREQAESLQDLMSEVEELKEETVASLNDTHPDTTSARLQELADRVDILEAGNSNLTRWQEKNKVQEDQQAKLHALKNGLDDLKQRVHQELQAGMETVNEKFETLQETFSSQENVDTNHSTSIDAILRRVDDIEKTNEEQNFANGNLRDALNNLQQTSEQQKARISALQQEVDDLNEAKTNQEALINELRQKNGELLDRLQTVDETRANSTAVLQKGLDDLTYNQQQSTLELKDRTDSLQADQNKTTEQLQVHTEKLDDLTKEQKNLQDQNEQAEDHYEVLSEAVEELSNTLTLQNDDLRKLTLRLQKEEVTRANSSAALQEKVDDISFTLEEQFATANRSARTTESQLSDIRKGMTSLQTSCEAVDVRVSNMTDELARFRQSVSENITRELQLLTRSEAISALEQNISSFESDVSNVQSAMNRLQVQLRQANASVWAYRPIRLVNGQNEHEGRVEIRVGREWGTVCDDDWGDADAKVICGMVGFSRDGARATSEATHGEGSGPIVLDDVRCNGNEVDIRLCDSNDFGQHNCAHSEDAGVICQP